MADQTLNKRDFKAFQAIQKAGKRITPELVAEIIKKSNADAITVLAHLAYGNALASEYISSLEEIVKNQKELIETYKQVTTNQESAIETYKQVTTNLEKL
ncbi:MAG: hypothetical protein F6K08_30040 [Okeania sp. SIO1H6]|nr:hypothetical protein [Okeania sp. SIO1H6]